MGERTTIFAGQVVTDIPGVPTPTYANMPVEIRQLTATPFAPDSGNATFIPTGLRYCTMPASGEGGVVPVRAVSGQTLPVSGTVNVQQLYPAYASLNKSPTYRYTLPSFGAGGYGAYATPTDIITLTGAAGKILFVHFFNLTPQSTSATVLLYRYIVRNTLNSGGVFTNPAPFSLDSENPAPGGVISVYTAAPTLGTLSAVIGYSTTATGTLTATAPVISAPGVTAPTMLEIRQSIVLRENQSLCLNLNGAALPAGFSAGINIEWSEIDA